MATKRAQGTALEKLLKQRLEQVGVKVVPTPNSGAVKGDGDVHTRDMAFDCKSQHEVGGYPTVNPKIDAADFEKIKYQAGSVGKVPALVVDNARKQVWVVMDIDDFAQLLAKATQNDCM